MNSERFGLLYVLNMIMIAALLSAACSKATSSVAPKPATAALAPALPTYAQGASTFIKKPVVKGQIVFHSWVGGHAQIFIENADGSGVRQLVKSEFDEDNPSLSPDGRTVVFRHWFSADYTGTFVINIDGSNLHQLYADGCVAPCVNLEVEGHPWSPDGKQILFDRAIGDGAGGCCVEVGWWVMNADGSTAHPLWYLTYATEDHNVDWSPDGKRIAFMRRDNTTDPIHTAIFTMATDASDLQQVTPWELDANDPAWSPDGTLIAFCSPTCDWISADINIYTIHPDGTGLTQLTSKLRMSAGGQMATFHPSWSPDGKQILFSHAPSTNGSSDLFVMNRDGSDLHVLVHTRINEESADWGIIPKPKLNY